MDLMKLDGTLKTGKIISEGDKNVVVMLPLLRLNFTQRLADPTPIDKGKHKGGHMYEFTGIFNHKDPSHLAFVDMGPTFRALRDLMIRSGMMKETLSSEKKLEKVIGPFGVFKKDYRFSKGNRAGEFADRNDEGEFFAGYGPHTCYRSFKRPDTLGPLPLIGKGGKTIPIDVVKAGDYAQVIVEFYKYTFKEKDGLSAEFQTIQMVAKGDALTGGRSNVDYSGEFKAEDTEQFDDFETSDGGFGDSNDEFSVSDTGDDDTPF